MADVQRDSEAKLWGLLVRQAGTALMLFVLVNLTTTPWQQMAVRFAVGLALFEAGLVVEARRRE